MMRCVIVLLVAHICLAEVCRDNSAYLCNQADCRQDVFKRHCCKTCSGPNPPTNAPQTPIYTTTPKTCGKQTVAPSHVLGDIEAAAGSWPWQILLYYNGYIVCGGTIISPYYVATAAHCVSRTIIKHYLVRVGEHDDQDFNAFRVDHEVAKVIKHGSFNSFTFENDIALIKLKTPVQYNQRVKPACLPLVDVKMNDECVILGWSKISRHGWPHVVLQQSKFPLVANDICEKQNKRFNPAEVVTGNMICGGTPDESKPSCHGNAGGGLICKMSDGRWQLQGIVSIHCDSKDRYTVLTKVVKYRSWIESTRKH